MSMLMSKSKNELRPRPFLIGKIAELVGGRERAANLAGCSRDTLDKVCNLNAGRDLTVEDIVRLIASAGAIQGNDPLDRAVDELAAYFVPPRRKLIYNELIEEQGRLNDAFFNSGRLIRRAAFNCHDCGQQLVAEMSSSNAVLLRCRNPACVQMRAGF